MPAAMAPERTIDQSFSCSSASRAASISAAAESAALVSNGIAASVMASPRAVSRPTALPTRSCSCCWLSVPATAASIATETVSRSSRPGAWIVSVVVLSSGLLTVDCVLS
jgi:hypothetical protein